MHLRPIPQSNTISSQYIVFALAKAAQVEGQEDLYQKVGIEWPTLKAAEAFQDSYEETHPHLKGKTLIAEQVTTWTVISDYARGRSQHGKIPTQRGLQRRRSDRDAGESSTVGASPRG